MNKLKNFLKKSGLVAALVVAPYSLASELTVPNQFSSGDVTSASDVNANFAAIEAAVNDNHARIQEGLSTQSKVEFVGFTSERIQVNSLPHIKEACYNLDPDSRMCTDIELMNAPHNPEKNMHSSVKALIAIEHSGSGTSNSTPKVRACGYSSNPSAFMENGIIYQGGGSECWDGSSVVACCK